MKNYPTDITQKILDDHKTISSSKITTDIQDTEFEISKLKKQINERQEFITFLKILLEAKQGNTMMETI